LTYFLDTRTTTTNTRRKLRLFPALRRPNLLGGAGLTPTSGALLLFFLLLVVIVLIVIVVFFLVVFIFINGTT
jgi:hypothetical protein